MHNKHHKTQRASRVLWVLLTVFPSLFASAIFWSQPSLVIMICTHFHLWNQAYLPLHDASDQRTKNNFLWKENTNTSKANICMLHTDKTKRMNILSEGSPSPHSLPLRTPINKACTPLKQNAPWIKGNQSMCKYPNKNATKCISKAWRMHTHSDITLNFNEVQLPSTTGLGQTLSMSQLISVKRNMW